MALIIPTANSVWSPGGGVKAYADATRTEGPLAKYVLAQFRSDAKLEWVAELRQVLSVDELKWNSLEEKRPRLKDDADLWKRVEQGVAQATIVIVDPQPIDRQVKDLLRNQENDPDYAIEFDHQVAMAIVHGTPIAHLPNELERAIPWSSYTPVASLQDFTPERILMSLAGSSKKAVVSKSMEFAARAHAIFDIAVKDEGAASTRDLFRSPLSKVLLAELLATQRFFDKEQPATIELLNAAAEEIAKNLRATMPKIGEISEQPLVREADSRAVDELQAADIAAGWARKMLIWNRP